MVVAIAGASASGKTTLAALIEQRMPGFVKTVTYTTRPIRPGEQNGVDYMFVTEAVFNNLAETDYFFEINDYRGWKYGAALDFDEDADRVIILTPAGIRALKRYDDKENYDIITVYLDVDRRSRLIKSLERGDDIEEAYRRNLSDEGQFDSFQYEVDYTIENNNYGKDAAAVCQELINIINKAKEKNNEKQAACGT